MVEKILAQGAEAIIIRQDNKVVKRRVKKGYRIEILDEKLRKLRTRSEAKLLEKAASFIAVPKVLSVDEKTKEIGMQFIEGKKLSESLDSLKNRFRIMQEVGEETAKLHDADIIHGDLTTSNMILADEPIKKSKNESPIKKGLTVNNDFQIYVIDFGLGFISKRIEDRAVDLHLIKQALEAKHFRDWEKLFQSFLEGYISSKNSSLVLEQLKKVEARGRYKN